MRLINTRSRTTLHAILGFVAVWGLASTALTAPADAKPSQRFRVSGPYVYENLDVYLLHGSHRVEAKRLVPLHQALEKKQVVVLETGTVSQLTIENNSDENIYIQAGDIVKGGRQDRTLGVDMVLPPRSGRVKIASFCVEQGRWRQRGQEVSTEFNSARSNLAHKELKIANLRGSQGEVWANVAEVQKKLEQNLKTDVRSSQSASSLQLTLENDVVRKNTDSYLQALSSLIEAHPDAIGLVFAINGRLNSADVYHSHDLFAALWPKLLRAAAVEAVAERLSPAAHTPPTPATVLTFLEEAEKATPSEKSANAEVRSTVRETATSLLMETSAAQQPSAWIHRSYLRK